MATLFRLLCCCLENNEQHIDKNELQTRRISDDRSLRTQVEPDNHLNIDRNGGVDNDIRRTPSVHSKVSLSDSGAYYNSNKRGGHTIVHEVSAIKDFSGKANGSNNISPTNITRLHKATLDTSIKRYHSYESDDEETSDESLGNDNDEIVNAVVEFSRQGRLEYEKLYRLLRENESLYSDLQPKNPYSSVDVVNHVARGSRGVESKYISTCTNVYSAQNLLSLKKRSMHRYGTHQIVEINVRKLPYSVDLIDLTSREKRQTHIQYYHDYDTINKFHRFASQFDEVLLVGSVPTNCIRPVN